MQAKLIPVTLPGIDLRAFVGIIGQQAVNEIDRKNLQPLNKFAEAVDNCFETDRSWAYWHTYQAFYFELPCNVATELSWFPHASKFRITSIFEGLMEKGIISAPLDLWRDFILWTCHPERTQYIRAFGNAVYGYFKQYPYFQDFQVRDRTDGTFALARVVNGRTID